MGTIVLHAGMGKAGSSSIQAWLARNSAGLREGGINVLAARAGGVGGREAGIRLEDHRSGLVVANNIAHWYESGDGPMVLASLREQLDAAASRNRVAIVSGEALERFFWRLEEGFLGMLDDLGRSHEVRVAYYVRPQHTAFEAHWRQWGFRSGLPPSESLARRGRALHYHDTLEAVSRRAPNVSFEPRPFRRDLLAGGDPGEDFARHFLAVEMPPESFAPVWSNRGLPLEVVNALRFAPPGLFWSSISDNERLNQIKRILGDVDAPEREETIRSRSLLRAHCENTFEPGNKRLIEALGWGVEAFVPPGDDVPENAEPALTDLDELWRPRASETELMSLFSALDAATSPPPETRSADAVRPPTRRPPSTRRVHVPRRVRTVVRRLARRGVGARAR